MMEFTLSRFVLFVCGAALTAAVIIPLSDVADSDMDRRLDMLASEEASAIDGFYDSTLHEMYIDGCLMLPSPWYTMRIDGYFVTITDPEGGEHSAPISHPARDIRVTFGEVVTVVRDGEWIVSARMWRRSCAGRSRNGRCPYGRYRGKLTPWHIP